MKTAAYIVLGKRLSDGKIVGYIEASFSMGLVEDRVRVNRSHESRYTAEKKGISERLAEYTLIKSQADNLNKKHKNEYKFKVFRVGSKNCPVTINWNEILNIRSGKMKRDKSKVRNLPFTVKENVKW